MYDFEENYVKAFQQKEQSFVKDMESWWLEKKNTLSEESEKFFKNGYLGFEIYNDFYLSTDIFLDTLKDWHRQVHDLHLPGEGVLILLHTSIVIVFNEGFAKLKNLKTLPRLENIPYFRLKDDFVLGTKSTFIENYIDRLKKVLLTAQNRVDTFINNEYSRKIHMALKEGNTAIEIYNNPLLYHTPYKFTHNLPSYLKIEIIQDKVVISLSDKYLEEIKEKNVCLNVYDTKQTTLMKIDFDTIKNPVPTEKLLPENIIKIYIEGYQKRLLNLLLKTKNTKFDDQENLSKLQLCESNGMIGFSVLQEDYILTKMFKKILDEINMKLPRNIVLMTSSTGELVLRMNVSDKILIENKCYGSYRNQKMFYTQLYD